eukprot:g2176.t1
MDLFPVWARAAGWHRSPPRSRSPPRRYKKKQSSSSCTRSICEAAAASAAQRKQTELGGSSCSRDDSSGTDLPERSSSSPPPPPPLPPPSRCRRLAAVALSLSFCVTAVVLLRHQPTRWRQQKAQHRSGGSSTQQQGLGAGGSALSTLPFLEGKDGGGKGKVDGSHWVRVLSSTAMHPAMYVPGDGMVYCPIAKVACAEWRKTLRWMLGIPDWDTGPIHDQGKNGIPLLALRKVRDVELIMNDDSWLKFVVVRDPADRLLSGFLNKCAGGEWQNCPYIEFMPQRFSGVKERNPNTDMKFKQAIIDEPRKVFRDFMLGVRRDVLIRGCKVNSHWRPQYCFCSIARFRDSYRVIPFSNMSSEAVTLVDHMRRPSPARSELLREFMVSRFSSNQDAKAQGATTKREKYFSKEALDVIQKVYEKDYDLFGEYFEAHSAPSLQQVRPRREGRRTD